MDMNKFLTVGTQAVLASMNIIKPFILGLKDYGDIEVKEHDGTLVTAVDPMSERAATDVFQKAFPDIPLIREEQGVNIEKSDSPVIVWFDGLDGTNAFTLGCSTPTVIMTAYDRNRKIIIGSIVGEPSTGRIWSASTSTDCKLQVFENGMMIKEKICRTWNGDYENKTVFIDVSHGFTRGKGVDRRQIITEEQMDNLLKSLRSKMKVIILGSNGINHALVANGNSGMVGTITTAMGGQWDVPTILGIEAGGSGQGFSINNGKLEEQNVLDPESYDIAIMANNSRSLEFLSNCVKGCI